MSQVFLVKTTLPGDWIEAFVGEFKHKALLAGAACAEHQRVTSMYSWEGVVQSSEEWSVQFTVDAAALESVFGSIKRESSLRSSPNFTLVCEFTTFLL